MQNITEHAHFDRIFDRFCARHYLSPIGDRDYAKELDIAAFGINANSSQDDLWKALMEYFFHSKEEIEIYGLLDDGQEIAEIFCEDNQGYHIFDFDTADHDKYYYCRSGTINITEFFHADIEDCWCTDGDGEFNQMINEYPKNPKNLNVSDK